MSKLDHLWRVHDYLSQYIAFADAKAGVVFTAGTAIIAYAFEHVSFDSTGGIFAVSASITAFASLAAAAFVVFPELRTTPLSYSTIASRCRERRFRRPGFIYWKSILRHRNSDSYIRRSLTRSGEHLEKDIAEHNHVLAGIADRKYSRLYWSMLFLFASVIFVLCCRFLQH